MNTFSCNNCENLDKQARNVVQLLRSKNLKLATSESCTGGLLSGIITSVSGSSQVFELGICAYANHIKQQFLEVSAETLKNFGAVSAQCAEEMASGIRRVSGAEVGVSTTGIAGPDGGTPEKPVGTVYISCSYKENIRTKLLSIKPQETRKNIRNETVKQALELIINTLTEG